MINTSESAIPNRSESIADLIVTARQYEISHGQILAYTCAGGLIQAFLKHKKYGLQTSIDLLVTPTSHQVITVHSLDYYDESHARDAEILVFPAKLLSEAAYAEVLQYEKERLATPHGCTLGRITRAQEKLAHTYKEIGFYQGDTCEYQIIDGYHPKKNEMFITALIERLRNFGISFNMSINLLNREIKTFMETFIGENHRQLSENIHK